MARVLLELDEVAVPGRLPRGCARCTERATIEEARNFAWNPLWVIILLVGTLIASPIIILVSHRCRVSLPFCTVHRNHWLARDIVFWLGPVVLIGGVMLSAYLTVGVQMGDLGAFLALAVVLLIPVWLVTIFVMQRSRIHAARISRDGIVLAGVSTEFVVAVEEQRQANRKEKPRR